MTGDRPANEELGVIETVDFGNKWSYNDIQTIVQEFKCGICDEVGGADEGATVRIELRLTEPLSQEEIDDGAVPEVRVIGVFEYTFK